LGDFWHRCSCRLVAPSKVRTYYAVKLDFGCTNNIAEYEALLLGL
jgi:ribonuclease HI